MQIARRGIRQVEAHITINGCQKYGNQGFPYFDNNLILRRQINSAFVKSLTIRASDLMNMRVGTAFD
jgi:hypothetical protein